MPILTVEILCSEAALFSAAESRHPEPLLYGVNDGVIAVYRANP